MTIADLFDRYMGAAKNLSTALKASGPQYLTSDNGINWVIMADTTLTGVRVMTAGKASGTVVTGTPTPTTVVVSPTPTPTSAPTPTSTATPTAT